MGQSGETSSTTILSTHQLAVGYAEHAQPLFHQLDLKLNAGELVCFMGPNGIGKSTLIRTLAGLQKQLSGKVELHTPPNQSAISVVLTDRLRASNMTVRELITMGRYPFLDWTIRLNEKDQSIINRAIDLTRTHSITEKKLYEISDGQTQMAMIARALAQDSDIIILDEPTAHLDLNNRVEIMNLLRSLARHHSKAVLVSTHELDLALQMADTIWLAGNGKDILQGIPEDLVLSGVFDKIFQFKGFDLKTGKVHHEAHRGIPIQVEGSGYELLWTKNALERNGFEISPKSENVVQIQSSTATTNWVIGEKSFGSIQQLLIYLTSIH